MPYVVCLPLYQLTRIRALVRYRYRSCSFSFAHGLTRIRALVRSDVAHPPSDGTDVFSQLHLPAGLFDDIPSDAFAVIYPRHRQVL